MFYTSPHLSPKRIVVVNSHINNNCHWKFYHTFANTSCLCSSGKWFILICILLIPSEYENIFMLIGHFVSSLTNALFCSLPIFFLFRVSVVLLLVRTVLERVKLCSIYWKKITGLLRVFNLVVVYFAMQMFLIFMYPNILEVYVLFLVSLK